MLDFNLNTYNNLVKNLSDNGYKFIPFCNYKIVNGEKIVILRHDVDRLPGNALKMAKLESKLNISGTYYFRIREVKKNGNLIKQVNKLGHEIGYHYEEIYTICCMKKILSFRELFTQRKKDANEHLENSIIDKAYELFKSNLDMINKLAEVKTIVMHGNPLSSYNNKILWKKYDYHECGIMAEQYLDINWQEYAYLTDTGRGWNKNIGNIRDKVNDNYKLKFRSTHELINSMNELPQKIVLTIHPERWSDNIWCWSKQLLLQNVKNIIKYMLLKNYVKILIANICNLFIQYCDYLNKP